jgi:hypothetical protein
MVRTRRAAPWIAAVMASIVIALVLMRTVYTTRFGIEVVDAVPEEFWRFYHRLFGLGQVGDVERVQNADGLVVGVVCLLVSSGLVVGFSALVRRRGRRRA